MQKNILQVGLNAIYPPDLPTGGGNNVHNLT
jgi:hypothetical protein